MISEIYNFVINDLGDIFNYSRCDTTEFFLSFEAGYVNCRNGFIQFNGNKAALKGIKDTTIPVTNITQQEVLDNIKKMISNVIKNKEKLLRYKTNKAKKDCSLLGIIKNYCIDNEIDFGGGPKTVVLHGLGSKFTVKEDLSFRLNNRDYTNKLNLADPNNRKVNAVLEIIESLNKISDIIEEVT